MNRRKFLIVTGAVATATYIPFGLSEVKAQTTRSSTFFFVPWQQYIWNQLQRGKKVMYVTSTQKNARRIFNLLKRHKNLFCTSMGAAICGRGADLIIMDEFTPRSITEEQNYADWFDNTIRTRLHPGGYIGWVTDP